MTDEQMTLHDLKAQMAVFVRERDWEQFHSPKNLSMSIAIEAAEMMEHFQWLTVEQSRQLDDAARAEIGEELADILIYSLSMANILQLDLTATVLAKMEKNRRKYPADKVRGKAHKYTYYQTKDES
ncbi:MAG: NTP pyrophosphohydrolase [Desulfuromonadales bacterium C00003093]|nr:MAG: NTP pyrophosphohydrolase [Desulfuromonadales bacterium C00003093]